MTLIANSNIRPNFLKVFQYVNQAACVVAAELQDLAVSKSSSCYCNRWYLMIYLLVVFLQADVVRRLIVSSVNLD